MGTAERIQQIGFKRWYERALIESHAYLITAFLGMITTLASIELIGERGGRWRFLFGVGAAAIGTGLVVFGVRRYYRNLTRAESLGDRATCSHCGTYAAFNVITSGVPRDAEPDAIWIKVQCRRCGNEWTM